MEVMVERLIDTYSQDFVELLANVLEPNPNRRVSFMEVHKMLENYWTNQSNLESYNQGDEPIEQDTANFESNRLHHQIRPVKKVEDSPKEEVDSNKISKNPSSIFNISKV